MRKFFIRTSVETREINANEYSVAPKTNTFTATVNGKSEFAASTAGKGKSAIPNYYLYFRSEGTLYYFRSNPLEIDAAKKALEIRAEAFPVEGEATEVNAASEALAELVESEPEAPKARRGRKGN